MKTTKTLKALAFSLAIMSGAAVAGAPANMVILNNSPYSTNAYVHGVASPNALAPHSSELIPWANVTNLCHGTTPPMLQSSDPCSFEVYATNDADPQQIDVGTVTMYLSDGHISQVVNKATTYGFRMKGIAPGKFALTYSH